MRARTTRRPRGGRGALTGGVAQDRLDPVNVSIPGEPGLDGRRALGPAPARATRHGALTQRTLESRRVARLDEAAVLAVDKGVPADDGLCTCDGDQLAERHRLEQDRGRARVAVLAHRQRDDARLLETAAHRLERDVGLDLDVRGRRAERPSALSRGDEAKRAVRHLGSDGEERPTSRWGSAPTDTTSTADCSSEGEKAKLVDTERHELSPHRVTVRTGLSSAAPRPRARCTPRTTADEPERTGVEAAHSGSPRSSASRSGGPIAT